MLQNSCGLIWLRLLLRFLGKCSVDLSRGVLHPAIRFCCFAWSVPYRKTSCSLVSMGSSASANATQPPTWPHTITWCFSSCSFKLAPPFPVDTPSTWVSDGSWTAQCTGLSCVRFKTLCACFVFHQARPWVPLAITPPTLLVGSRLLHSGVAPSLCQLRISSGTP